MNVAPSTPRFAGDLLFQTKKLNVYASDNPTSPTRDISLGQIAELWGGISGVMSAANSPETPEGVSPSREAAGFKIELGGRNEYTPEKLQAEKKGWFSNSMTVVKESIAVFLKKINWMVSSAEDKFAAFGKVFKTLFQSFSSPAAPAEPAQQTVPAQA